MKFGQVEDPTVIDFTLPKDHFDTEIILEDKKGGKLSEIYVGCAKWSKQDLKGFYPRGTKDELAYYSSQFNSIELNATFYNNYGPDQIMKWRSKVLDDFKFFPKVNQTISHFKRLIDIEVPLKEFCENIRAFEQQMGMVFLQLHDNFSPKNKDRLENFLRLWPADLPLAVELRNTDWFNDREEAKWLYYLLETHNATNIITDTAGRRDLLHMRLTNSTAFVRYVGANHDSDYVRLDDWVERIKIWQQHGLEKLYFFVHQNLEVASPLLSGYFIEKLNSTLGVKLRLPDSSAPKQGSFGF